MRRLPWLIAVLALGLGTLSLPARLVSRSALSPDFVHFESGQVHPLCVTPGGARLLVVNTSDNRLSVFDLAGVIPRRVAEVPVGLEPVAVACPSASEAWVVNRLSDDVSIVDLETMNVRATVRVGDEPDDIVFAGSPRRAYVSVSQEDAVEVLDPARPWDPPVAIAIPGRRPRALAVTLDQRRVMVSIFHSSGGATVLSAHEVQDSLPAPDPPMDPSLPEAPEVGLIVTRNAAGNWVDAGGKIWNSKVPYDVPKVELVTIDTGTRRVVATRGDMMTNPMGIATNPVTGAVAMTGTRARIEKRFEPNLRGYFTEQRLALVEEGGGAPLVVGLDPHIDYSVSPGPPSEADSALGMPTGVAWSPNGLRLFVTSLTTDRLGVLDREGRILARVPTVAGPTAVVADPLRGTLYVLGRFHQQLQTLSASTFASLDVRPIGFDPTPDEIVNGRRVFYGGFTSGHGDQSCAGCHLFGDVDGMVWDLGDPRGSMLPPPPGMPDQRLVGFHPMKGPMATQSLRGLRPGVLHWRGDRAGLAEFNPAFVSIMGRSSRLPDTTMAALSDFVMTLTYPPNPYEPLDRSVRDAPPGTPSPKRGRDFFLFNLSTDEFGRCSNCHALPTGDNNTVVSRLTLLDSQDMKVPHLRNLYTKTGFTDAPGAENKKGFGYMHDGAVDNVFDFLKFPGFDFGADPIADARRRDVEAFLLAFDTGMAPAVGGQITFDGAHDAPDARTRLDTLAAQAEVGNCDLIARGRVGGRERGWLYQGAGRWTPDRMSEPPLATAALLALAAPSSEITVTGVPSGCGMRMGLNRDRDGAYDTDEVDAGTDPGDPRSYPRTDAVAGAPAMATGLGWPSPNPFRSGADIAWTLSRADRVELRVYDVLGREVTSLARGAFVAGSHRVRWDGRRRDGGAAAAGLYFVRLETSTGRFTRPIARIP